MCVVCVCIPQDVTEFSSVEVRVCVFFKCRRIFVGRVDQTQ